MITEGSSNIIVPDRLVDFEPDGTWDEHRRVNGLGSNVRYYAAHPITFVRFDKIRPSEKARYLVKGVLPNEGLVVVWGEPKCGKSFFVFDLVAHVAAGREYRGRRVKQRPVVYFALEGQEGFTARVEAFRKEHGDLDIPFYLSADRIVLPKDGPAVVQSISRQFPAVRPGLVVLDTLNRSIAGSENDPDDMGKYVRAADMIRATFNCVVIVIHHCGVSGDRPRGHTSLTGAADAQLAVKRDAVNNIVATVEYMKDGPEGDQIFSRLKQVIVGIDEDGDDITSCVIEPADDDGVISKAKVSGQPRIALGILQDLIATEGVIPAANADIPASTRTISQDRWRAECYARMFAEEIVPDSKRTGFRRSAQKLQELKRVGKYEDHVWLI